MYWSDTRTSFFFRGVQCVQCKRVNLTETILNFLYYLSTSVHPIIVLVTRNITMRTIQTLFLDLLGHGRLGQSL